jgi:hypothetical protein
MSVLVEGKNAYSHVRQEQDVATSMLGLGALWMGQNAARKLGDSTRQRAT